ncbi:MAG: hypothetical protein LBS31_06840 [Candidatus Adiutrix sp.]|jgi:TPR repeat protein|nr:hypothetical protein [Candidatus Adiutrix sp.]
MRKNKKSGRALIFYCLLGLSLIWLCQACKLSPGSGASPASPGQAETPARPAAGAPSAPAQTGEDYFKAGRYAEAYRAFLPRIQAGDLAAVYYVLVIRRNALDGRPADLAELAALRQILALRAEVMRAALKKGALAPETEGVYRTALAELAYFGLDDLNVWPPPPRPDSKEVRARVRAAQALVAPAVFARFAPALNFMARLAWEPVNDHSVQVFVYTSRAAAAGDRMAMGNLAWLYRDGIGTGKDDLRAAHWARESAAAAPPVARGLNEAGCAYESGRGVTASLGEAQVWYEKSAAQGHPAGQANLERLRNDSREPPVLDNLIMF